MEQRKYGLFTAIAMIVGIVIGSGIFFKSDNILYFTGGNIALGVFTLSIAAMSIVFGCLTVSELATRTDTAGGVVTYAEKFWNKTVAVAYGWFHTFIYYPSLIAVIAWVSGIYVNDLFGLTSTLETQVFMGLAMMLLLYLLNFISAKLGGYFQNISTVIKLLPLILFALVGVLLGNPSGAMHTVVQTGHPVSWIAALAPVLFAYDGWIIATSICHEIKNSKRNLPLALIIAPIIILILYISYFVGISCFIGPDQVIALGDGHVSFAAQKLLGSSGGSAIMTIVTISVLGTLNGLIVGGIRMPYSLAIHDMFPCSKRYINVNPKNGIPMRSAMVSLVLSLLWLVIHYFTQKSNVMPNADVSEISIVVNYLMFIILYLAVIKLAVKGEIKSKIKGYVIPALAIVGSLIIMVAGMQNPMFWIYLLICGSVIAVSLMFWYFKNRKQV